MGIVLEGVTPSEHYGQVSLYILLHLLRGFQNIQILLMCDFSDICTSIHIQIIADIFKGILN